MRKLPVLILMAGLLLQGFSAARTVSEFGPGEGEATAVLRPPGFTDTINITLPAECHVLEARMNVTTAEPDGEFPDGPVDATVMLGDTVLYEFNGTGYGGFGRQTEFADGNATARIDFGPGGGTGNVSVLLPKGATVESATMDVTGAGPDRLIELYRRNGTNMERFCAAAKVGDLNNDGYDDLAVGANSNCTYGQDRGVIYIFKGGPHFDLTEDLIIIGNMTGDAMGTPYGVGDLNGDNYDDIAVFSLGGDPGYFLPGGVNIFFGGDPMDNVSDLVLSGNATYQVFGMWMSGAADVNGDGFDDLILTSRPDSAAEPFRRGQISVYYGGKSMDTVPDLIINAPEDDMLFNYLPIEAPDLNGDGFDDIVIGAPYAMANSTKVGKIFIYFGGQNVDNVSDMIISGSRENETLGWGGLSCAGDVNGDGYDDLIVGETQVFDSPKGAGLAFIYYGGPAMDGSPDVALNGFSPGDDFGVALGPAGDINDDGYDDVLVGADNNLTNGPESGAVYFYLGGQNMDSIPDFTVYGQPYDIIGWYEFNVGDLNYDEREDIVVCAILNWSIFDGGIRIYSLFSGLLNSSIDIGTDQVWIRDDYFNGTERTADFSELLNKYLGNASTPGNDSFGNALVTIPFFARAGQDGALALSNLSIVYSYKTTALEFSKVLNDYISTHKGEKDSSGNITVPISILSKTGGRLKLVDLRLELDDAPGLAETIPVVKMSEDTAVDDLVDLHNYFIDDHDQQDQLNYNLVSSTNGSVVTVTILDNRYVSIDALNGSLNDNWTGTVDIVVKCSDRWNSTTFSNMFRVTVQNVPDPPVFISLPRLNATAGSRFQYQAMAVDGDMDPLSYSLPQKPPDMTVDPNSGLVEWVPKSGGTYPVTLNVTDGQFSVSQNLSIFVPNQVPVITSLPNTTAITTVPYEYEVNASDPDSDPLEYSLLSEIPGMTIDSITGNISWVPQNAGDFSVKIKVKDSKGGETVQEFMIHVYEKVEPKMEFVSLPEKAKVEGSLEISGRVLNGSLNVVSVQYQLDSGEWINLTGTENWSLNLDTTKMKNGNHVLKVRVYDGQEFTEVTTRSFTVNNAATEASKPFPILVVVAIIGLAAVAGALMFWKGKRPPDEEE